VTRGHSDSKPAVTFAAAPRDCYQSKQLWTEVLCEQLVQCVLLPRISVIKGCALRADAAESQQESLTNWALNCLSRSYLRHDYDFTNYWTLAGVQKMSNAALELSYRYNTAYSLINNTNVYKVQMSVTYS